MRLMENKFQIKNTIFIPVIFFVIAGVFSFSNTHTVANDSMVSYTVDTKNVNLKMYWKDSNGKRFGSIQRLKNHLARENQTLLFACNGGMYKEDRSPVGLYIESGKTITPINTADAQGNFYLKPNGVFYITKNNQAAVCKTEHFKNENIQYATQSGPMLVIDGHIHPAFKEGSKNVNIRNGVGILPNGNVHFAMSKSEINFYDFAFYFKNLGCKNALYFDGFVSRTYLPEKNWIQTDGDFGVMVGVTK